MTRKRPRPSLLLLAAVGLLPGAVDGQTPVVERAADSACTYTRCALRVDYGIFSTRLVRGASGESVSRLGWFGSGVGVLLGASDSAAHHARDYQTRRRTADLLGIVAGALVLVALVQDDEYGDGLPFAVGGIAVQLIAIPYWLGFRRSLDRAVWWYNRELPRP